MNLLLMAQDSKALTGWIDTLMAAINMVWHGMASLTKWQRNLSSDALQTIKSF